MRASWTPIAHTGECRQGDSLVYDIARFIASPFSYDVVGFENITTPGPALYIANHLSALGPIETILSVPIRFYPWIISEMLDFKLAPKYLFDDFIHPVLHRNGRLGLLLSCLGLSPFAACTRLARVRCSQFTQSLYMQAVKL